MHYPPSFFRSLACRSLAFATFVLIGVFCRGVARAQAPFYLKDGDKVVFYGDSITDQRLYTTFTETFVLTRFPNLKVSFVHSGWGGDRVTGGAGGPVDLRLDRDVLAFHPSVVTIMLGMNDGGYRSFDQHTAETYEKGYLHILDTLQTKLPGVRLTLIGPSPYDDFTRPPKFDGGYNQILQTYDKFAQGLAASNNQTTADFNAPLVDLLNKAKQTDPELSTHIISDRVHPGPGGHIIMAETLLKAWNAPGIVTDVAIDAATQKVVRAENTKIDDLKAGDSLTWMQTDGSLPMPTFSKDPKDTNASTISLALKSSDFTEALNREPLQITGLKAPFYQLKIDTATIGLFSREDLEKGINLVTLPTPMMAQATDLHQLTLYHNNIHYERWRNIQVPLTNRNNDVINKALPPILTELDNEEQKVIAEQRAKAQPLPHRYTLTPQQSAGPVAGEVTLPVLPSGLGSNLALQKKYVSSNQNTSGWDAGLTDGSWIAACGTTYASGNSAEFPKTVTIDLEKPEQLAYLLVGVPPFGATKTISISLSRDNQTFTQVGNYQFPQNVEARHLYTFPATEARYIRLTYPDHYENSPQYGPNYVFTTEVEAYAPVRK